jgi:hypothetical protein
VEIGELGGAVWWIGAVSERVAGVVGTGAEGGGVGWRAEDGERIGEIVAEKCAVPSAGRGGPGGGLGELGRQARILAVFFEEEVEDVPSVVAGGEEAEPNRLLREDRLDFGRDGLGVIF